MFETVLGIPAHPLLIHATVVFVPLLIAAAICYGLVPSWRKRLDWAVILLAFAAPISAFFSRQSGMALLDRLTRKHEASNQDLVKIAQHESFGTRTLIFAIVLGVLALVLVGLDIAVSRRSAALATTSERGTAYGDHGAAGASASTAGWAGAPAGGTRSLVDEATAPAQAAGAPAGKTGGERALAAAVLVLTVIAAGITGYYVFKTGDTGAHIVWQGR